MLKEQKKEEEKKGGTERKGPFALFLPHIRE